MTGFDPDHPGSRVRPSPNFGERRDGAVPDMIVLHYTGMTTGEGAEAWLCDKRSEVSSHYLVHEDGRIVQMVREADRAWHAGASCWRGRIDLNSVSIGIEIVNPGHFLGYPEFPPIQIDRVVALCLGIRDRFAIAPERVLAHSDIAPGRKIDPGEKFPWDRLAASGVGLFVMPQPELDGAGLAEGSSGSGVAEMQALLASYGYDVSVTGLFDQRTRIVVAAFQRHFRPARVDGVADASTMATLGRLLAALNSPVLST